MKSSSCLGLTYKFYFWLILTDYSSPLLTFGRKGENLSMCTSMATFYSYLLVFHCLSLVHGQLQMEINRDSPLLIDDSFKLPRNTTECLVIKDIPSPSCFKYLASPLRQRRTSLLVFMFSSAWRSTVSVYVIVFRTEQFLPGCQLGSSQIR